MRQREILKQRQESADTSNIDIEVFNRYVDACQCPYCQDGIVYKMLSLHISLRHHITAYELREDYGFTRGHKLVSPEWSEERSEISKNLITPDSPFMKYDRSLSIAHRYEDGGARPEAIRKMSEVANRPEVQTAFRDRRAKFDMKERATHMSPDTRQRICHLAGVARWRDVPKEERQKLFAQVRARLKPEDKVTRTKHAQETLNTKYRDNPEWVKKWKEVITKAHVATAKISRSEYENIVNLSISGLSQVEIGRKYNVSHSLISLIIKTYNENLPILKRYGKRK